MLFLSIFIHFVFQTALFVNENKGSIAFQISEVTSFLETLPQLDFLQNTLK